MPILRNTRRSLASLIALAVALIAVNVVAAPAANAEPSVEELRQEIYLNGDMWEFKPIKIPFYGWEESDEHMDRSFIRDAIDEVTDEEWDTWYDVRVPSSWNNHHEFDKPDFFHHIHKGEYRRSFDVPESFDGQRIKLHFEGVNWKTWVSVNGTLLHAEGFEDEDFTHEYAMAPFDVDITDLVEPGSTDNELSVVVHDVTANMIGESPNEHLAVKYPSGLRGQYWDRITQDPPRPRQWYEAKSGLFRDVSLVAVPHVYVEDVFVRPDQNNNRITADVTIRNEDTSPRSVTVDTGITTWADGDHALTFTDAPTLTVPAGERVKVTVESEWNDFQLWWPDDPFLYTMATSLSLEDGTLLDVADNRFGVRDIKAVASEDDEERGFYVNGVRTALLGESIEMNLRAFPDGREMDGVDIIQDPGGGDSPDPGEPEVPDGIPADIIQLDGLTFNGNYAMSRSYFSHVIDVAKSMNINVLRIHRGWAMSKELVEIADEKGMMLIAENPVTYWGWETHPIQAEYREAAIAKVLEFAKHYRNHPSIVIWSISNENDHYDAELTQGMQEGFAGRDAVNPDIQLVSANHETAEVSSDAYMGGYIRTGSYDANKAWFTYEENASYMQFSNAERRESVMDSMRIMRQQRMSLGYDAKLLLAFYNFQKVFELPSSPTSDEPMKVELSWTEDEINGQGYNAQYMWQSIMNPYASTPTSNFMDGFFPSSQDLWARSYAPIAVFDQGWVDDAMHGTEAVADYSPERTLHLFHNDLSGNTDTELTVQWRLLDGLDDSLIREGSFVENVSLGGTASRTVNTGDIDSSSVRLELTVLKSGEVQFTEVIDFGTLSTQPRPGGDVIVMDDGQPGTYARGLASSTHLTDTYGPTVAYTNTPDDDDVVRFTPHLGSDGEYDIRLHVPFGLAGTQAATVAWYEDGELLTHTENLDVTSPGWIELGAGPFPAEAGDRNLYIEFHTGGTSPQIVIDAVTFQKVKTIDEETAVTLDQRRIPGFGSGWEYIGRYDCAEGLACQVTMTNDASARVIADAVRFVGPGGEFIIDEGEAEITGDWERAGGRAGSYGSDFYYINAATPASATITWTPDVPNAGEYDIYLNWDNNQANNGRQRALDTPVTISTAPVDASTLWDVLDDDMLGAAHWIEGPTTGASPNGSIEWTEDGARLIRTPANSRYYAINRNDYVAPSLPYTYEFTGRSHDIGTLELSARGSNYYTRVIIEHGTEGEVRDAFGDSPRSLTLDTTVDHTYRVVVAEDGSYSLYVNGELAWADAPNKGSGGDILKIGPDPHFTADFTTSRIRVGNGELLPDDDPVEPVEEARAWASVSSRTVTLLGTEGGDLEFALDGGDWQSYSAPFTLEGTAAVVVSYRAINSEGTPGPVGSVTVAATEAGEDAVLDVLGVARTVLVDEAVTGLGARVADSAGGGIAGVDVTFTVVGGEFAGGATEAVVATNAAGIAVVPAVSSPAASMLVVTAIFDDQQAALPAITVVEPAAELGADVEVTSSIVAGRYVLNVAATNTSGEEVTVKITTRYGTKTFTGVADGGEVSHGFNTFMPTLPPGTVTVTVTGDSGIATVTTPYTGG